MDYILHILILISIAMTTVFPEPVAILEQSRLNDPPSEGMSMPTFSEAGASVKTSVEIAIRL